MEKIKVAGGIQWVSIPEADLRILCGCPADSVKHLMKKGLIRSVERAGVSWETGPNAILLSDVPIQNGAFSNLSEFPVLQMLYRQGMILPGHPNNTGQKPLLIGIEEQVRSQSEYIFRGNYGLSTLEEIVAAGVPEPQARDMMRCKMRFAFDSIRATEDLLELCPVDKDAIEPRPGVFLHRKALNCYEILHGTESVEIDLNLPPGEETEPPYRLGTHGIRRQYFSVIHIGEGDGWDTARPCMGSLLCHQGRLYLVDAGPNILYSLTSLGIDVSEIEGVFQTHAHDDHFAGLTSLVRSGRRLRYFAAPFVRSCVEKKLSALMGMRPGEFGRYFDVQDLAAGEWNSVQGLEVRPVWSPHPVETTVFFFRSLWEGGPRTYAHLADLASFDVLRKMITADPKASGVSAAFYDEYTRAMREPADLKKLDAGLGLVHGNARDFAGDMSRKLILSHSAQAFSDAEKEIGSETSFAVDDVLVPAAHAIFSWQAASRFLSGYFPDLREHEIALPANCPEVSFAAGSLIIHRGTVNTDLYLILGGTVDMIASEEKVRNKLSAGALIGELSGITGEAARRSFRAHSTVTALRIPCELYREFIRRGGLLPELLRLRENRQFLQDTALFGEMASFSAYHRIARLMELRFAEAGGDVSVRANGEISILRDGTVGLGIGGGPLESMARGGFWGEESVLGEGVGLLDARALERCEYFTIPGSALTDISSVQWKLMESFRRRILAFRTRFHFEWRDVYRIGIRAIDDQHRTLFALVGAAAESYADPAARGRRDSRLRELLSFTEDHFATEERLMRDHGYPGLDRHRREHEELISSLRKVADAREAAPSDPGDFLKDWLVNHTLLEDRKYGVYMAAKGVR